MKTLYIIALFTFILNISSAYANAVSVAVSAKDQAAQTVTFSLSWQNSWRMATAPNNWDGVWLFVKFRPCGSVAAWTHGVLDLSTSVVPVALEATKADGSLGMDADNLGLMVRQAVAGVYPATGPHTFTFKVTNMPTDPVATPIDIKVFGIETVFVPTGDFYVGDGTSACYFNSTQVTAATVSVTQSCNSQVLALGASYPRGVNAFYIMKYEISQGQYAGFLNTIDINAQILHYPGFANNYRQQLVGTGTPPNTYFSDYPNRAQNYLDYSDIAAYLDWCAFRPMSELEFEKACRGLSASVANEYAWGSTNIYEAIIVGTTAPIENGSEQMNDVPVSNCNYSAGPAFTGSYANTNYGPLRCGIFALPTSNREGAGASYYGVLEMSGNLWELVIPLSLNSLSIPYTTNHGDGYLAASGEHDVANWPLAPFPAGWAAYNQFVGWRGGSWENATTELRTSDRNYSAHSSLGNLNSVNGFTTCWNSGRAAGGRGVRGGN